MRLHVALLGDSILDNASYVGPGQAVEHHLRRELPGDGKVTLVARDGATCADVARQLPQVPGDATHVVLSVGGNDALGYAHVVTDERPLPVIECATQMHAVRAEFAAGYRDMLAGVLALDRPLVVCTVYDAVPRLHPAEAVALCVFNDVILRQAFAAGATVVDLRSVCHEPAAYAAVSPIEPSEYGGRRIAAALRRALLAPPAETGSLVVG